MSIKRLRIGLLVAFSVLALITLIAFQLPQIGGMLGLTQTWTAGNQFTLGTPTLNVVNQGYVGNGTADDTASINNSIALCPVAGCEILIPAGTTAKITSTINFGLHAGIWLHGVGTGGTGGCSVTIQANGAINAFTVGTGTSPNSSGFIISNLCIQDMTGNGLSAIDVQATRGGVIRDVHASNYSVGACHLYDGGVNFTQFIADTNNTCWHSKYGIQAKNKTASIYVSGGEIDCQNSGSTDVIPGSIGIDLNWTYGVASTGASSEWVITTQTQNCQVGRALWNSGGNKFVGDKANEVTIVQRAAGTIGVEIGGDTSTLASNNIFLGEQVTGSGIGFWMPGAGTVCGNATSCTSSNTTIYGPIFNGTNGMDLDIDATVLSSTKLDPNKQWTGWTTNVGTLLRDPGGTFVTLTTVNNGTTGLFGLAQAGTYINVAMGTGTSDFNGTFLITNINQSDSGGTSTVTWNQSGTPNESATVTPGFCTNSASSCVQLLSTITSSGLGTLAITGSQQTQDVMLALPSTLPTTTTSSFSRYFFDSRATMLIEPRNLASNGPLHVLYGFTDIRSDLPAQYYQPQPTTTLGAGVTGVPSCIASPINSACPSADDKELVVEQNTNGTTICLPPAGTANGFPPGYSFKVAYLQGTVFNNVVSITVPGQNSFYSSAMGGACPGTSGPKLDNETTTVINLEPQTSAEFFVGNDNNWWSSRGTDGYITFKTVDAPGAITVNANTCTDRSVSITGINTNGTVAVAANYSLEANILPGPGQVSAGTAHYRLCNVTTSNIALASGSTFNIIVRQAIQ